jgi:hypothetical protein
VRAVADGSWPCKKKLPSASCFTRLLLDKIEPPASADLLAGAEVATVETEAHPPFNKWAPQAERGVAQWLPYGCAMLTTGDRAPALAPTP